MSYSVEFSDTALEDYQYWKDAGSTKTLARTKALLSNMRATPFKRIGKPEPLKHNLSGYWSRRIDREHRIVYKVEDKTIFVIQLRYHY